MTHRGFTLIELIVSVSILLLLAGLLVAGYNGFNSSQTVIQAAATFKNNLVAARSAAASGVKPAGCDTLVGYEVDFPDTMTYTSGALCLVGGTQQIVGVVSSYSLPSGVLFSPLPQSVIFYSLDRGASVAESITIQGVTVSQTVSVSLSGSVDVSGAVPTPTPCDRGCAPTPTPTGTTPPPIIR